MFAQSLSALTSVSEGENCCLLAKENDSDASREARAEIYHDQHHQCHVCNFSLLGKVADAGNSKTCLPFTTTRVCNDRSLS